MAKEMRKRILFVDDDEEIRSTVPPILTERGFAVTVARKVSDALREANRTDYDVLVSDLNIENADDGFIVVSSMHLFHPKCINFILTESPTFHCPVEGVRRAIAGHFVKPVQIDELVNAINQKLQTLAPDPTRHPERARTDVIAD